MFHLYINFAYFIPGIYLFFRIWNLFISKESRLMYIFIYLALAAIFPVSDIYAHREMNSFMQVLSAIAGYLLPFYLYLFLCMVLYEVFLLLNLIFRFLPAKARKSHYFRLYTFGAMILFSAAVVVAGAINLNTIRISEYQIKVPKRDSQADSVRIAFVADLHLQQNTRLGYIEQFVRKVNAHKPDLMLYGGDMLEGDYENESTVSIESAIKNIHTKYGSFGVLGNHEYYGGREESNFFRNAGIMLLLDTIIPINNSYYLAGRYDQHFRQRKPLKQILNTVPGNHPVFLLDHRPLALQEASSLDVDVQFSGHTHNGQLFPLNLFMGRIYEVKWGHRRIGNTHFFVTSGLRLWGPPVKTAGKSEIMIVDIYFE